MKKVIYLLAIGLLVTSVALAQAGKRSQSEGKGETGTTTDTNVETKSESESNANTNTNTNTNTNDGVTETTQEASGGTRGHWVAAKHNLEAAKRHLTQAGADASVISSIDAALSRVNARAGEMKGGGKKKHKEKHDHHGHGHGHDHKH